MKMHPVKSSNLTHIGYEDGKMHVTYKSGHTYEFSVTPEQHKELMAAESHGKHLNKLGIKGTKVNQ